MLSSFQEIQRQIELAAKILEFPEKFSEEDLAEMFFTSTASIRRDMKTLRESGFAVYSRKRAFRAEADLKILTMLISACLSVGQNDTIKNLPFVVEKLQNQTLTFFVATMRAIREKLQIEIEYRGSREDDPTWRTISPIAFYNAGKSHYLIALHRDQPKMYILERIYRFRASKQKSELKEIPSVSELFRYAWGSFTGGEISKVKLLFRDNLENYLSEKFWLEEVQTKMVDDGFEVTMKVKVSNEFMAWIMGWGDAVTILEPKSLKEGILKKAQAITENYKK